RPIMTCFHEPRGGTHTMPAIVEESRGFGKARASAIIADHAPRSDHRLLLRRQLRRGPGTGIAAPSPPGRCPARARPVLRAGGAGRADALSHRAAAGAVVAVWLARFPGLDPGGVLPLRVIASPAAGLGRVRVAGRPGACGPGFGVRSAGAGAVARR